MGAQSALGAARPRDARGIRHAEAAIWSSRGRRLPIATFWRPTRRRASPPRLRPRGAGQRRPGAGHDRGRLVGSGVRNRVGRPRARPRSESNMMENAMLSPDRLSDPAPLTSPRRRRLRRRAPRHRPYPRQLARAAEIDAIAEAAGVTPTELHHLFRRWAGLTPKAFLQALTLDHARRSAARFRQRARRLLRGRPVRPRPAARPVRHPRGDVARRMEVRRRRADDALRLPSLAVRHGAGDGDASAASPASPSPTPARKRRRSPTCSGRWPQGELRRGPRRAPRRSRSASSTRSCGAPDRPLRVVLIGTDFEVRVWETLLSIPMGRATTYSDIAGNIGKAEGRARGRRRGRQEPGLLRGAVPSRARQERRAHRLSLGPDPQARHAGLGSRHRSAAERCEAKPSVLRLVALAAAVIAPSGPTARSSRWRPRTPDGCRRANRASGRRTSPRCS